MKKINRVAIYDPHILTLGGGEKYVLTIAEYLLKQGSTVDLILNEAGIKKNELVGEIKDRFGLDIERVGLRYLKNSGSFGFYPTQLRAYDVVIYLTIELPRISPSKKSLVIVQFPFDKEIDFGLRKGAIRKWFQGKLLKRHTAILVYSTYVSNWVRRLWKVSSLILPPPIDTESFVPSNDKKDRILSVARFFDRAHNKKQLEMVKAFKDLTDSRELKGWRLTLAGGVVDVDLDYLKKVREESEGYPIDIETNISLERLRELYKVSKIFWHAAGMNENENKNPEKMEHFGMTTLEAMSAGCVPVVIARGGQVELINSGQDGYLWRTEQELKNYTVKLAESDLLQRRLAQNAIRKSKTFSKSIFLKRFQGILDKYV